MSVYALEQLISETRRLAKEFRHTTGQMLPVTGEIARFDAAYHLNLELLEPRVPGVDALADGEGQERRYQIKGRVILDESKTGYRIGQLNPNGDWTHVVLVLLDGNFEPFEMYEGEREEILQALAHCSGKRARRGAMSIAKFKAIGRLIWTRENGIEEELWSNY